MLAHDPIEETTAYRRVVAAAEEAAWVAVEAAGIERGSFGSCWPFWAAKQRILREHYGVAWRTPSEMNPGVIFD